MSNVFQMPKKTLELRHLRQPLNRERITSFVHYSLVHFFRRANSSQTGNDCDFTFEAAVLSKLILFITPHFPEPKANPKEKGAFQKGTYIDAISGTCKDGKSKISSSDKIDST
jgi:hypothetical protein